MTVSALDLNYVRSQFPAFDEPSLQGCAFFENAGGSYACRRVISLLDEYYHRLKVQPYYRYPASLEAGQWMDQAYVSLAEYLGVAAEELHFGPSTSQNTYVLAQAFRKLLRPGDEIIVTNQDHEGNSGVWRRLADYGIVVREWRVNQETGALELAGLEHFLGTRTRLVVFTHCSNILGQINPAQLIVAKARDAGAVTVVDGVAFAPHGLPDVGALGADVYLFSLYKTYGPHQGLMVVRRHLLDQLANEGHYFNAPYPRKRLLPAGPDHAQIASARGIAEYFDALDTHHGGQGPAGRPQRVRELLRKTERALLPPLLEYLRTCPGVRLLGPSDAQQRAPTIAFVPHKRTPVEVQQTLADHEIMCAAGHFYAVRLLEAMGVEPERGVVRLSLVHYNSSDEVARLLTALRAALD